MGNSVFAQGDVSVQTTWKLSDSRPIRRSFNKIMQNLMLIKDWNKKMNKTPVSTTDNR